MKDSNKLFNIKYARATRMQSPYADDKRKVWHLFVNVRDIPGNMPTEVNPRKTNMNTKVAKAIINWLELDNESFFINNRGMLISAKRVIDNLGQLSLDLGGNNSSDLGKYGVLDGGHTYRAILETKKSLDPEITQYVHLEIITNIDNVDDLAAARNTSVQVDDKAIAELANKFSFVKNAIKKEPYRDDIAYKQNDDKQLDAVDLVRLMYAFNVKKYPRNSIKQPIQSYSGKSQVLKDYLNSYTQEDKGILNPYRKLAHLLPQITKLYDQIELTMPQVYNDLNDGDTSGRFGRIVGVEKKDNQTKFYKKDNAYQISQGLILPILGGFRSLVSEDFEWTADPLKVWNIACKKLVNNTISMSRQLSNNPQSAGKSSTLWSQNYDTVLMASMSMKLG